MLRFTLVALVLAVALATVVSPFASPSPDGLERVAADSAFLDRGRAHPIQEDAPVPDYAVPGVTDARRGDRTRRAGRHRRRVRRRARRRRRRQTANMTTYAPGLAGDPASPVHRLDPRAKLIGLTGVTLVAVSTPLHAWPAFVACALALVAIAALARVRAATVWTRGRLVLPAVLCVAALVPFMRAGGARVDLGPITVSGAGLATFATVAAKAALGTGGAVLLSATTAVPDVLAALERLRAPRLLVLIAAGMYRYLFVVAGEVSRTRAALAARAYRPRNALQAAAIGRAAGALFLRSYTRGERVHVAMLARGYRGTVPRLRQLALRRADAVFLGLLAAWLVPVRVAAETGL